MKAEELQLNDLVSYEGHATSVQVLRLGENIRRIGIESSRGNVFPEEDEIQPIPLTAEILEKNGFVRDGCIIGEDGYRCDSYNLNDSQVWGYLTKEGFDIAFGGRNQPNDIIIKYVHELQRVLRCCDLWDLADSIIV